MFYATGTHTHTRTGTHTHTHVHTHVHTHRDTHVHTDTLRGTLTNRKMTYRLIEMEIENTRFSIWNEISIEFNLVN
jgi:hypothetical protein